MFMAWRQFDGTHLVQIEVVQLRVAQLFQHPAALGHRLLRTQFPLKLRPQGPLAHVTCESPESQLSYLAHNGAPTLLPAGSDLRNNLNLDLSLEFMVGPCKGGGRWSCGAECVQPVIPSLGPKNNLYTAQNRGSH